MTVTSIERGAGSVRARRRTRFTARAGVLALVVAALLLSMVVPFKTYMAQRARLGVIERQTRALEEQNATLREEVRRLRDPRHLELMARCLGMVRPGELAFVVVPGKGSAPGTTGARPPAC